MSLIEEMQATTTVIKGLMDKLPLATADSKHAVRYSRYLKSTLRELLEFDNLMDVEEERPVITKNKRKIEKLKEEEEPVTKKMKPIKAVEDDREWICNPGCLRKFPARRNLRMHMLGDTNCKQRQLHNMTAELFNVQYPPFKDFQHSQIGVPVIRQALVSSSMSEEEEEISVLNEDEQALLKTVLESTALYVRTQ